MATFSPTKRRQQRVPSRTNIDINPIVAIVNGDEFNPTGFLPFNHDPRKAKVQQNAERGKRVRIELEEALKE